MSTKDAGIVMGVLDLLDALHGGPGNPGSRAIQPMDVIEDEDAGGVTMLVDVPGFSKEQVTVTTKGNRIHIVAERDDFDAEVSKRVIAGDRAVCKEYSIPVPPGRADLPL